MPACCSSFCRQALGLFCWIIVVCFYDSIHFYPCPYLTLALLVHGPHVVWECVCVYVCMCVCVHMYVCVCVDRMILKYALCWHIHKSVHPVLCQCRHAHICMHVCTHACTHTCMHTRMHAHTHTDLTASLSSYSLFDINVTPS